MSREEFFLYLLIENRSVLVKVDNVGVVEKPCEIVEKLSVLRFSFLILCGKMAIDGDTAQVGAELAEFLGIPNVSNVLSILGVEDGKVHLTASLDQNVVEMKVTLPCLISIDGDVNTPRLPSYRIRKAMQPEVVRFLSFQDLEDQDEGHYGLSGSATQVERIFSPEKNNQKEMLAGSAAEQAEALLSIFKAKKMI